MTKIIVMFTQSAYFELDLIKLIWYPQILSDVSRLSLEHFSRSRRRVGSDIHDPSYDTIRVMFFAQVRNVRNIELVPKSMPQNIFAQRLERGGIFRCPRAL